MFTSKTIHFYLFIRRNNNSCCTFNISFVKPFLIPVDPFVSTLIAIPNSVAFAFKLSAAIYVSDSSWTSCNSKYVRFISFWFCDFNLFFFFILFHQIVEEAHFHPLLLIVACEILHPLIMSINETTFLNEYYSLLAAIIKNVLAVRQATHS